MAFDKVYIGLSFFDEHHVEERNSISSVYINLAEDLRGKQSASPASVDLSYNKTAVLADEEIYSTVATLFADVTVVSCIFADLDQGKALLISYGYRVADQVANPQAISKKNFS